MIDRLLGRQSLSVATPGLGPVQEKQQQLYQRICACELDDPSHEMGAGWVYADFDSGCCAGQLNGCAKVFWFWPFSAFLSYPVFLFPGIWPGAGFAE
jgi:hypothetical protein